MKLTLIRSLLAVLFLSSSWLGMAQTSQDAFCNVCNCTPTGSPSSQTTPAISMVCGGAATNAAWNANTIRRLIPLVSGNEYRLSICGATENTVLYVTTIAGVKVTGACDDDGCGFGQGPSSLVFRAPSSGNFYIWAYNGDSPCTTLGTHTAWTLSAQCLGATPVPANDDPCGAPVLSIAAPNCAAPVAGTTLGATPTSANGLDAGSLNPNTGCGVVNFNGSDVWYQLAVPATGLIGIEIQESGLCAAGIGLYKAADCGAGPFEWITGTATGVCSIDGLFGPQQSPGIVFDPATYGLAPSEIVYVRVWERGGDENGSFTICAYNAPKLVNDDPCGAITLTVGNPCTALEFNTINAQPKPAGLSIFGPTIPANTPTCGTPAGFTPALWNPVARDVWFRVVVPPLPSNGMTVTTFAGTLNDMGMAWYRASGPGICPPTYTDNLTQIAGACAGSLSVTNRMPRLNSNTAGVVLTPGETVYIRLWNKKDAQYNYQGTFSICVTPNLPPVNDNPCGAIALEVGAECILFPSTNENATNTGASFLPGASTAPLPCGTPPANYNDVWFTVEVPIDLTAPNGLIFDTDDQLPLNFAMAAYRDISGQGCPTLVQLAAVGACATAGSGQGNAAMPLLQLQVPVITPGERLYIRVWTEVNNQQGPFSICARRISPPDCQGTFYDSGGVNGVYGDSESQIRLHCAEKEGDVVTLNFSQFNLESGFDFIRVYNQDNLIPNAANLIGTYTGTYIPSSISGISTVANPRGCLLVVFSSDVSVVAPGYTYKISCGPPPIPVAGACNIISYSPGATVHPGGTTSYDPGGASGTTYPGNLGVQAAGVAPYHVRYCPSNPGEPVTMTFVSFDVEDDYDGLYIFNADIAPGTPLNAGIPAATQISSGNPPQLTFSGSYSPAVPPNGAFWGGNSPGTITATINANNPNGCLTLVFYTDAIVSGSGWEAIVSCAPPPPPPPGTPCDQLFYETPGGSTGNYANNVSSTQTFPGAAGRILTATFQSFDTEPQYDKMYVFDGPTTNVATKISSGNPNGLGPAPFGDGAYWGIGNPGPFTSSTAGGALTFHFVSDFIVVRPGWVARLSCPAQAANDEPCVVAPSVTGATLVTPSPTCNLTSTSNLNATSTSGLPIPGCGNYQGGDVWYRFVAPPSGRVFIDTKPGTLTDAAMALYSGVSCSGPFTLLECDDDDGAGLMPAIDRMCNPLTPGATYWLRVWGSGNRRGTFDLCIVEGSGNTTNQTDCGGAFSLCTSDPFSGIAYGNGCGPDLTPTNWGCLAGERQGSWYAFRTNVAGQLGMTITPSVPVDIDWAIWQGNLAGLPNPVGGSCLPSGAPIRCSFASLARTMSGGGANPTAATGMGRATFTGGAAWAAPAPPIPDAADGWVPGINVGANQMYLLFVDDHHLQGIPYTVTWQATPTTIVGCEILPVEAMQLQAQAQPRTVDLLWNTTREENTSHFIIERSTDGQTFIPIGRSDAVGHSAGLTEYRSVDDAPEVGLNYYRLQLVDMDGSVTLSNIVTALFQPKAVSVMVVPNPSRDQAELLMSSAYDGTLYVRIMDGSGRLVASFLAPTGMQRMQLPIAHLEGGSYTVQLVTEKGEPHARTRFVKH